MTPEQRACKHRTAKGTVGEQSKINLWVCGACGLRFTNAHLPINPFDEVAVAAAKEANIARRTARLAAMEAAQRRNGDGKK